MYTNILRYHLSYNLVIVIRIVFVIVNEVALRL